MPPPAAQDPDGADRFRGLWQRCLIEAAHDDSESIHRRIVAAYNESGRYYHSFDHIRHCLEMFDQCRSRLDNPDAVELGVWFHDVVFEPGKADNEARSAALYAELSDGVHLPEIRALVDRLIMATLHNGEVLDDEDTRYMVDIDLSSFGLPWKEFLRDSENLRREAGNLSDAEYYGKALGFHDGLRARERFYQTEFFAARFETQARQNIARYLEHISA